MATGSLRLLCPRQEEYKAEGLDVAVIPFQNNEAIIDLICKRPLGLMIILEDQVIHLQGTACCFTLTTASTI